MSVDVSGDSEERDDINVEHLTLFVLDESFVAENPLLFGYDASFVTLQGLDNSDPLLTGVRPSDVDGIHHVNADNSLNDTVNVMRTSNAGQQRVYDKKHFCFICGDGFAKLPRHLISKHSQEPEIIESRQGRENEAND